MNFAAAALLGLTVGQPPGQDYHVINSRQIRLPIEFKKDRQTIRGVSLYVSRNGENMWTREAYVTPDATFFTYVAKDDGVYWFKMQIEDLKGNRDPADVTRPEPPDSKIVIDTVKPVIRVTGAKRTGDEVVVEWAVDDKFPNDEATRVQFRATAGPDGSWQDVTLPPGARTGVRFASGIADGVTVRIAATDLAGNRSELVREFPAGGGNASAALPPATSPGPAPAPTPPAFPANPGAGATAPPALELVAGGPAPLPPGGPPAAPPSGPGILPPQPGPPLAPFTPPAPGPGPALVAPAPTPPLTAPALNTIATQPPSPAPTVYPTAHAVPGAPPGGAGGAEGLRPAIPQFDPAARAPFAPPSAVAAAGGTGPAVELTRAQAINTPRFSLSFELDKQAGPSGLSRIDLWATRDDGQTWVRWSVHKVAGAAPPAAVPVALDVPGNPQLEGGYGFKVVPVSGAGLSDREPAAGTAPDMRVVLDVTPPRVELKRVEPEPGAPDTLVIKWEASDRNFGDDPIALEWSDSPTGPWRPVATTVAEPVVQQAGTGAAPLARRLPNTGQYSWRVPPGVPAKVHLKITARDAAGNVRESITENPILVDLTTPKAKIVGIVPSVAPRP